MEDPYRLIETSIRNAGIRRGLMRASRTALLAVSAAAAVLVAGLMVSPSLGGLPLVVFRAAVILGLAASLSAGVVLIIKNRENLERTARAIERQNPWLENALINSVQLIRASTDPGPAGAFSNELLHEHIKKTAALLPEVDFKSAAPASMLRTPGAVFALLAVILFGMASLLPQRSDKGFAAIFTRPWEMPSSGEKTAARPLTTGDFTLHYSFPPYSGIEPQTVAHTDGDMAALKGTSVTLETMVLEPLESAALVTSTGARYAMEVEKDKQLQVELVLSEPGTYYIEGMGKDGERYAEPDSHRIVVDEDLPPEVTMLEPVADVEVAAEGALEISYEAGDDFGLRKIELVYERGDQEHRTAVKGIKRDGERNLRGDYEWRLSEEDFLPGERIPFYIEVTDNDEVAGGKPGRSDMRVLEIFSARKFHRQILARQDELLNRMIDHLASHLVAWLADEEGKAGPGETEADLLEEGGKIVEVLEGLITDLAEDEYADEIVMDALVDMSMRYPDILDERARALNVQGGPDLAGIRDKREQYRAWLENDIIYLDKLVKKQRIEDILAEADSLYQAQADMADLLAQYKRTGDPALLEKLRDAMAELQSAFQSLMQRMAKMRKSLPEEFVNADALDKANVTNLAKEMEKLRKALVDGDLESAAAMAEDFLSKMGQWMSSLEDKAGQFGEMMSKEVMQGLSDMDYRLEDLINRQQVVEDALQDIYNQAAQTDQGEDLLKQAREEIKGGLDEFQEEVHKTHRQFFKLRNGAMQGKAERMSAQDRRERYQKAAPLSRLKRDAQKIDDRLEEGDLGGALDQAREVQESLQDAMGGLEAYAKKHKAGPPPERQKFQEHADKAREAMQSVLDSLQGLKQRLAPSLDPSMRSELEELSKIEEDIRRDVQEVMDDYSELQEQAPSLPGEVLEHLDQASLDMNDAAGEMMLGNPGPARAPARDARAQLEKARESVQGARQKMGSSMMGMGMPMGMSSSGRNRGSSSRGLSTEGEVDIPEEDAYKVPEEFREQILKAMKEDSPEAYKNLNRDYYERLVR